MKSGTDLQECSDASYDLCPSRGWIRYTCEDLQQSRFPCSIGANDPNGRAGRYLKRDVLEGPEVVAWPPTANCFQSLD